MKVWRIATALILTLALAGSLACNAVGQTQSSQELVEVKHGNLMVKVSGSGNIEIGNDANLTFGVAGRIDKIYVNEGDNVTQGETLARLETDSLEVAVAQAQMDQAKAQLAITQAEVAVNQANLAVSQGEVTLQTAKYDLDKAENIYKWPDIEIAQANVDSARASVQNANDRLAAATTDADRADWVRNVALAEAYYFSQEAKLNAMLSGADTDEVAIKKHQVDVAQQSLELSQQTLAQNQQSLELTQKSQELTQRLLEQAQKQLDKAAITAPLNGVIASVNADEQDTVSPANIIMHLINPKSLELKVQIDEIDIASVKEGQKVTIDLDALPSLAAEGSVSSISQLSSLENGVVVYNVKIKLNATQDTGMKSGMSATANIITEERNNILLVPDRAIKQDSQGRFVVDVMNNKQIEERVVVIGISDGTQTEIIDGLKEGEILVIK